MSKSESAFPPVIQSPGWWKVTDRVGDVGFWEFREDGRARLIRGRCWDWCRVQPATWEKCEEPSFLEWANADPKPSAVWGEPGYMESWKRDKSEREKAGFR